MTLSAYEWLPFGLNNPMILTIAGTLIVTGFVNAGNMADGANGLLGIVGISFLSILITLTLVEFCALFLSWRCSFFVIFNVSTGQIFLGDFGAYGLSAIDCIRFVRALRQQCGLSVVLGKLARLPVHRNAASHRC